MKLTYSDQFVFRTSREVTSVRAEADTSDVQVARNIDCVVLENANLLTALHVVDLGRTIAAGGNIFAIVAESYTTHHTFVVQSVHQIDIKSPRHLLVENTEPVRSCLLRMGRNLVRVEIT